MIVTISGLVMSRGLVSVTLIVLAFWDKSYSDRMCRLSGAVVIGERTSKRGAITHRALSSPAGVEALRSPHLLCK